MGLPTECGSPPCIEGWNRRFTAEEPAILHLDILHLCGIAEQKMERQSKRAFGAKCLLDMACGGGQMGVVRQSGGRANEHSAPNAWHGAENGIRLGFRAKKKSKGFVFQTAKRRRYYQPTSLGHPSLRYSSLPFLNFHVLSTLLS